MTKFAQLLLVLTSLAPIAFVEAAVAFDRCQRRLAIGLSVATVLLVALCLTLLWGLRQAVSDVPKEIKDPVPKESEPLAFLVAYALPLVSAKQDSGSLWGLGAFTLVMAIAVWQQQMFHVNPLLAILGFHFSGAKTAEGGPVTIISRMKTIDPGTHRVIRLSDSLWIYVRKGA